MDRIERKPRTRALLIIAFAMGALVLVSGATAASQEAPAQPAALPTDEALTSPSVEERGIPSPTGVLDGRSNSLSIASESLVEGPASLFVPISAYRMYDSRSDPFEGKWTSGDDFPINALTDEFGDRQIPDSATAVAFNVAAVATEGRGFIQISDPYTESFSTSTVNWTQSGLNIANSGSTMVGDVQGDPGWLYVAVGGPSSARTEIIIDITGYYIEQ